MERRVNGCRTWQYPLSKKSNLEIDTVKWEDLPTFSKEFGWLLSSSSDNFFEWIKVQSQEICEVNKVLKELKIFNDWTFAVHVNSPKVAEESVGIFELGASKKLVSYLFDVLSKYRLCKGFPVPSKRTAKDTTGMTVGGTVVLHLLSTQCHVLLPEYNQSPNQLCEPCTKVKTNCSITCVVEGSKPAAKKRESYMSEEELREKLYQEQNRTKNAERRLHYLRRKAEDETKVFGKEDREDFLHIFRSVEKASLSEDMRVFWEVQEKVLSQRVQWDTGGTRSEYS